MAALLFMNLTISQESDARNIQVIPRLESRIEVIEKDIDALREYTISKSDEITENRVLLKSIEDRFEFVIQRFNLFEKRIYDRLFGS